LFVILLCEMALLVKYGKWISDMPDTQCVTNRPNHVPSQKLVKVIAGGANERILV